MAFKRYAALLAGSALAGSALFAQPAMAEEAATEPAEFSYAPVTVEKGQKADSEAPSGADDCTRILPVNSNKALAEDLGANVDSATGVVTFDQTELETLPEAKEYDLQIACAIDEADGEKTEWKIAPIKVTVEEKVLTFNAITAEQGAAVKLTQATAPAEFTDLKATTEGFTLTTEDDGTVKLTVGAAVTEGEKTVDFTYEAYGNKDLKGSVKVTVKTKTDEDEDEDKDEPKENASSKASSNFLGSFKGSSK